MTDITINSDQLAEIIVAGIREKKGENIVKLDLRKCRMDFA